MDLQGVLYFILGLLVRLGIPVGLTIVLIIWFSRLDARWQEESEHETALEAKPASNVPCWEVKKCASEDLAKCPAHAHPETPCWQLFRNKEGQLRQGCIGCQVFEMAPVFVQ